MINKIKPKSEFSRNVLTLMTGTTIAQAIPIAISPILTRIYTPEDFGVFALYMSLASILSIIVTGRYELAIMLPKKDKDAINIVVLSIIISFLLSIMLFLVVFVFNAQITKLLGNQKISIWLYFIPLTVLITGMYQNFYYWSNRKKDYKKLSVNKVVQSSTISSTNLLMGISGFNSSGLIIGNLVGQSITTIILGKSILKDEENILQNIKKSKILILAKKYIKFPTYDIPASTLNALSQQMPAILFTSIINASTAGYYYFTQKTLNIPIGLVASAVLDVFKEQASKDFKKIGNAKKIYLLTLKKLFLLSFIPLFILFIVAPDLFSFIFGAEWRTSGLYAQLLIPMLFLRFMSYPLSFMFYIGEKQVWNLFCQLFLFIMILISFYIGKEAIETVKYISMSFSGFYLLQLIISAKIAGVYRRKQL